MTENAIIALGFMGFGSVAFICTTVAYCACVRCGKASPKNPSPREKAAALLREADLIMSIIHSKAKAAQLIQDREWLQGELHSIQQSAFEAVGQLRDAVGHLRLGGRL